MSEENSTTCNRCIHNIMLEPEAQTESSAIVNNTTKDKDHSSQLSHTYANLLKAYPMQWALNRKICVLNTGESLYVNAYKLATQSQAFKELLRMTDNRKLTTISSCKLDNQQSDILGVNQKELRVVCNDHMDHINLLCALHICHIGNTWISGITRLDCIPDRADPHDEVIFNDVDACVCTTHSQYSLIRALKIASYYQLKALHESCLGFVQGHVDSNNCLYIWTVINRSKTSQLVRECGKIVEGYILANFSTVIQTSDRELEPDHLTWSGLSIGEVEYILSSPRLNVNSEGQVIKAIQQWILSPLRHYSYRRQRESMARYLACKCVRVKQLSLNEIEMLYNGLTGWSAKNKLQRRTRPSVKPEQVEEEMSQGDRPTSDPCANNFLQTFYQTRRRLHRTSRGLSPLGRLRHRVDDTPGEERESGDVPVDSSEARLPHEAIVVLGGWKSGTACNNAIIYDPRREIWHTYGSDSETDVESFGGYLVLPHPLMSFGIALVDNRQIYVAGGESIGVHATANVLCNDLNAPPDRLGWKFISPMQECRRDLVLVHCPDWQRLYAIGGDNNRIVLNSVERYDLDVRSRDAGCGWTQEARMLVRRGAPAADYLDGRIYVCGGYTENGMEAITNLCEALDVATGQWTMIQPMSQARYYCHALAIDGALFVLGGGGEDETHRGSITQVNASTGYISTVERYDPDTKVWELMPPINNRADFAACLFEGKITCLGGGGEAFCTDQVEYWKPWKLERTNRRSETNHGSVQSTQGPVWLRTESNQLPMDELGWVEGVRLPKPIWGHRCCVLKGVDLIARLIASNVDEMETSASGKRAVSQCCCSCSTLIDDYPVLVPSSVTQCDMKMVDKARLTDGRSLNCKRKRASRAFDGLGVTVLEENKPIKTSD